MQRGAAAAFEHGMGEAGVARLQCLDLFFHDAGADQFVDEDGQPK